MELLFYLYAFLYIYRCVKGIYYSRRKSLEHFELLKSVNPFENKSIQDRMHNISEVNDKIKSKSGKVFVDFVDLIWAIVGMIFMIESVAFFALLTLDILARIIPVVMIRTIKSYTSIQRNMIWNNILSIIICFIILYNHFFNLNIF